VQGTHLDLGEYFVRARYYSPDTGRFCSADLIRDEVDSVNPYSYVGNRPTTVADPSGLRPLCVNSALMTSCCEAKVDCSGGCIIGKDAVIKSCKITKLERLKGSSFLCRVVTEKDICKMLQDYVDSANKDNKGKEWFYNFCQPEDDCECKPHAIPKKTDTVVITDEIIKRTEDTRVGKVTCIFKISAKLTLTAGYLVFVGCQAKK